MRTEMAAGQAAQAVDREAERERARAALYAEREECAMLRRELAALDERERSSSAQQELEEAAAETVKWQQQATVLQRDVQELEQEVDWYAEDRDAAVAQRDAAAAEVRVWKARAEEARRESVAKDDRVTALQAEVEAVRAHVAQLESLASRSRSARSASESESSIDLHSSDGSSCGSPCPSRTLVEHNSEQKQTLGQSTTQRIRFSL